MIAQQLEYYQNRAHARGGLSASDEGTLVNGLVEQLRAIRRISAAQANEVFELLRTADYLTGPTVAVLSDLIHSKIEHRVATPATCHLTCDSGAVLKKRKLEYDQS